MKLLNLAQKCTKILRKSKDFIFIKITNALFALKILFNLF